MGRLEVSGTMLGAQQGLNSSGPERQLQEGRME